MIIIINVTPHEGLGEVSFLTYTEPGSLSDGEGFWVVCGAHVADADMQRGRWLSAIITPTEKKYIQFPVHQGKWVKSPRYPEYTLPQDQDEVEKLMEKWEGVDWRDE